VRGVVVQWAKPNSSRMIRSLRSRLSMTRPTELSARPRVEGLDQVGGGEVPDPVAGLDCGDAERDEQVALAGACGTDPGRVFRGAYLFQAGQVVEGGGRDRGRFDVEVVECPVDGERGGLELVAGVGGVAGGDLGLDQALKSPWRESHRTAA
jgi:hypothetical protein